MGCKIPAAIVLLLIATVGVASEVDTVSMWQNETIIPQYQHIFNTFGLGEGVWLKQVRISELFQKKYRVLGNTDDPEVKIVFDCYPGYKKLDNLTCQPTCDEPCRNGQCLGLNDCRCFFGFVKNLNGDCIATCPFDCLNGRCEGFDGCKCNPGYELDHTKSFCIPVCNRDCGLNGNCTSPDHCGCNKGYKMSLKTRKCEPVCKPECGSGICVEPGKCLCDTGFKLIDNTCQANCSRGCENGRCVAEERCKCDFGWVQNQGGNKCTPVCRNRCIFGDCVAPDKCKCYKGYKHPIVLSTGIEINSICEPKCEPACINGICVAPNSCRCHFGYFLRFNNYHCQRVRVRLPGFGIRLPKARPKMSSSKSTGKQVTSDEEDSSEEDFSTTPFFDDTIDNHTAADGFYPASD